MQPEAPQPSDLPCYVDPPRLAQVQVLTVAPHLDPADPSVEAVLVLRRRAVNVIDFYRGRPAQRSSA